MDIWIILLSGYYKCCCHAQDFVWVYDFNSFGYKPRSGIAECLFNFRRTTKLFSVVTIPVYIPTSSM